MMIQIGNFEAPAAIVLGGTLLATVMRCGLRQSAATLSALGDLTRDMAGIRRFDAEAVRSRLAVQIGQISRDGLLRCNPRALGDAEFDAAIDVLLRQRSLEALLAVHQAYRIQRGAKITAAIRTLVQAAELAPVFGLAGTLLSLTMLPSDGVERGAYLAAIGTAVHATLYGLTLAHLVLMPLATWVERSADSEETERRTVQEWLSDRLALLLPDHEQAKPAHHVPIARQVDILDLKADAA